MDRRIRIAAILLTPFAVLGIALLGAGYATFGGVAPITGTTVGAVEQIPVGYGSVALIRLPRDRFALIDCGEDESATVLALQQRGIEPDQVRTIFLTHGHRDHTGSCHKFTKAKVYAGNDELPLLRGEASYTGPLTQWFDNPAKPFEATPVDGHLLLMGTIRIKPYVIPGHTPGSVAYQVGDVLHFGDAAVGMADGTAATGPWIFNNDSDENRRSVRELARSFTEKSRPNVLMFSHSGTVEAEPGLAALAKLPK